MSARASTDELIARLRQAGAPQVDAVGWHYLEVLAERSRKLSGTAHTLLDQKLLVALHEFSRRMDTQPNRDAAGQARSSALPSPLALLLQEMSPPGSVAPDAHADPLKPWRRENPQVQQFRKQLRKISVQKQVSRAIAQGPQNAGPINSHMLVLRALGLMRDISPDYLNRFMTHLDTLLCLEEAEKARQNAKKAAAPRNKK